MLYYEYEEWIGNFDSLLESEKFELDKDEKLAIDILLHKGIDVYTTHDPFEADICNKSVLIWHTDKEILKYQYNQMADDI